MRKNDNIWKTATGQRDEYTTGCLLDYNYFNDYYKMIAIDLSKQQELDADPKTIQQIHFTGNLDREADGTMFFILTLWKTWFWVRRATTVPIAA